MGVQLKRSTSLDAERQAKLWEMLAAEPLATVSSILAVGVDAIHALWRSTGRDLKGAIGAIGALGAPDGTVA